MAEQPADLVERVVLVTASAQGVLLDAAADLVDDLGAEPHHVEGVKDCDRVGQPVTNRVRISTKRIQAQPSPRRRRTRRVGRSSHALIDRAGAAHHGVQQPGVKHPAWSRVRSTMIVTARSTPIRDGRQMCSSTPRVFTFFSRDGSPVRALASTSIASQQVCQSTPRWRASAETVVSS